MPETIFDIEAALICLRKESLNKKGYFNIRYFLEKHSLNAAFKHVLKDLNVFTKEKGWDKEIKIEKDLILKVHDMYTKYEDNYVLLLNERFQKRKIKEIGKVITEYNIEKKDIYISVNAFADKVPQEILANGIGVGNGIFLINITHFEKYRNATC